MPCLAQAGRESTLLNLIAGFLQPASGSIIIENNDHTYTPPAASGLDAVPENNLFTHLTVRQNIALGMDPGLKLNDAQRQKLEKIAGQMGITTFIDRLPGELSGGQRQRVALARCRFASSRYCCWMSPSALDPALRRDARPVQEVRQRQQLTMLMVSHSIEDAARIAPRSVVIAEGRIVWEGETEELMSGKQARRTCWGSLTADHLQQDLTVHRHQRMANQRDQRHDGNAQRQRRQPQQARARQIARQTIDIRFRAAP